MNNLEFSNKKINYQEFLIICNIGLMFVAYIQRNFSIAIISSMIFWLFILTLPLSMSYALCYFAYPISGIFDELGFFHLFNISTLVLSTRVFLLTIRKGKVKKDIGICLLLMILLFVYDFINAASNNLFGISYLSNATIWITVLLLALTSLIYKEIDINKIHSYLFYGFVVGAFLCFIYVKNKYGGLNSAPSGYRFVGMLRDPNYYSICGIVIAFSSFSTKGNKGIFYFIVSMLITLLSISKMSILLFAIGILLLLMSPFFESRQNISFNSFVLVSGIFFLVGLIFIYLLSNGVLDWYINKFLFRIGNTTLTTGRTYLQGYYLTKFFNEPVTFLFGRSLGYAAFYNVSYGGFDTMVSHNTYIDIFVSFGILGASIYLWLMVKILRIYKKGNTTKVHFKEKILPFLFIIALFALSYLQADGFAIIVLYLCIITLRSGVAT